VAIPHSRMFDLWNFDTGSKKYSIWAGLTIILLFLRDQCAYRALQCNNQPFSGWTCNWYGTNAFLIKILSLIILELNNSYFYFYIAPSLESQNAPSHKQQSTHTKWKHTTNAPKTRSNTNPNKILKTKLKLFIFVYLYYYYYHHHHHH